ncbi:MAG: RHS repeat-associated core domain-containing protein [Paludibacter sp.]|nr:RHS repeat-associated core domain-containing protein [Paludibacter sp.]
MATFTYNDDYDRATMQIKQGSTETMNKYYFASGKYEIEIVSGIEKQRLYLDGSPYTASILLEKTGAGSLQTYYLHRDYLGSITQITDNSANLAAEYSYDAWGRLRNPANWQVYAQGSQPSMLYGGRGYTGHEQLNQFGLINMNARLYDPLLARFLAPDPFVGSGLSNDFNRYIYCRNNPMMYTDPSGKSILSWLEKQWNNFSNFMNRTFPNGFEVGYSQGMPGSSSGGFFYNGNLNGGSSFGGNYNKGTFTTTSSYQGYTYSSFNPTQAVVQAEQGARSEYFEYNTASSRSDISLYTIGIILNGAGFVSSAGEYSNVINGEWIGINGKWNSLEWGGNQWTGARQIALSKAGYFNLASKGFFYAGAFISGYQGYSAFQKGDYLGAAKSGLDIGLGAFATFGGPPGWIIGGGYFALDALGAFDSRPFINVPYNPSIYSVQDNTYVAPSIIRQP